MVNERIPVEIIYNVLLLSLNRSLYTFGHNIRLILLSSCVVGLVMCHNEALSMNLCNFQKVKG